MEARRLRKNEMEQAARVFRASFDKRLPWLASLHTPDEDREYFENSVFSTCGAWGAFEGATMVGFIAFREGWIDQLYVLPAAQGRGVGGLLLDVVKPGAATISLWTFQRNDGARRFYERRGFVAIEETDGSGNEEGEPDILYRWTAPDSGAARQSRVRR